MSLNKMTAINNQTRFIESELAVQAAKKQIRRMLAAIGDEKNENVVYTSNDEIVLSASTMTKVLRFEETSDDDRMLNRMIKDACKRMFSVSGVGVAEMLQNIHNVLDEFDSGLTAQDKVRISNDLDALADKFVSRARSASKYPSARAIEQVLCDVFGAGGRIAYTALLLAGASGKINLEKNNREDTVIEITSDYQFSLERVLNDPIASSWNATNARCLVIDGVVDSMSEIDTLFFRASELKEPVLIVARGFHNEVLTTIVANRYRRTLNVHAFCVPFDSERANALKDIAIAAGCDPISALKGQLISTVKLESLPVIERVSCDDNMLKLQNSTTQRQVGQHIADLRSRMDGSLSASVEMIINDRMKSLTGHQVTISIPRTNHALFEQVDAALRFSQSILRDGVAAGHDIAINYVPIAGHDVKFSIPAAGNNVVCVGAAKECMRLSIMYAKLIALGAGLIVRSE